MNILSFLKLVEIQTKIASMIPFILGTLYAIFRFNQFNTKNFIILFISILTFDMTTTAINNYFDYKRANKKEGYNYEQHNAIVRDKLKPKTILLTIAILFIIASVCGITLFLKTNIFVLLIGILSFSVGILYSFGPIPISRTPLGEVFSGFFMGFVIVFLSVYVHIFNLDILGLELNNYNLTLNVDIYEIALILLISMPSISGIANIMLANNICDIDDDKENNRYTLPIYIGKKNALNIFSFIYYVSFVGIILLILLEILPYYFSLIILELIPLNKNIKIFNKKQTKQETFVYSVKNLILLNLPLIILLAISNLIDIVLG